MTPEQLEETYTELCSRLTAIGDDSLTDGLARVTLLLMNEVGNPSRLHEIFEDALSDLTGSNETVGPWHQTTSD